jgi:hypothetical protein
MLAWFTRLFSRSEKPRSNQASADSKQTPAASGRTSAASGSRIRAARPRPAVPPNRPVRVQLTAEHIEFLEGLLDPPETVSLVDLSSDDRWFVGGVQKRWRARQLELPVFSEAAIQLTGLLRSDSVSLAQYVQVVERDPALTVEVLRSANAAIYAAGQTVHRLDDAIRRIGLKRLGSVLILAQLNKRILKAGSVADKAALLMDLASPLGLVASQLTTPAQGDSDLAFTRGSLLHVEHVVILGAVADISRENRREVKPSVRALLQACRQFGPEIRQAVATAWNLQHVLLGNDDGDDVAERYSGYCRAVISRWLDRPLPVLPGVDPARLAAILSRIPTRIQGPTATTTAQSAAASTAPRSA